MLNTEDCLGCASDTRVSVSFTSSSCDGSTPTIDRDSTTKETLVMATFHYCEFHYCEFHYCERHLGW